ncbi:MAG: phosphatase PAP2 family protein [Mycolicibacterium sp.]|nr:phosphatase PAP2 family protein [Mycolicibacterium sp.]
MAVALTGDRRVDIDDVPAVTADTDPLRERGLSILRRTAIAVWAVVVVFRTWTTGFAFNRELLLIYICTGLIAASIGRRRVLQVIRDWLPFALILVVYDLSRGAATLIGTSTLWQTQPRIDRWLFFGAEPTVWLQEHFKLPDPPWWEVVISSIYMSFFVLPYVVAGVLWLRSRDDWKAFTRRFLALSFIALVCYAIVPAAPPWAAARCTPAQVAGGPSEPACMFASPAGVPDGGLLGPMDTSRPGAGDFVERISTRGWGKLHLGAARALVDEGQASVNLVAAIPSLHAALTAMIAAFLWRRIQSRWRPLLAAYVVVMAFTLVYSAEHYVFDILLGWALALTVHAGMNRLEARRSRARDEPVREDSRPVELEPLQLTTAAAPLPCRTPTSPGPTSASDGRPPGGDENSW